MSKASSPIDLTRCKVLLIEDERIVRDIVLRMLKEIGIKDVTEVSTAEAGWGYLVGENRRPFHVLITDLTLPGVSGTTLIKELRALQVSGGKELPIIVLTGSNDVATYKKVAENRISSYLIKPISREMLRAAIEKAVVPAASRARTT